MMWTIIAILIISLILGILKDTHVKEYYCSYNGGTLINEFDVSLSLWHALTIIIVGLTPGINIFLFVVFIIVYLLHMLWDPEDCSGYTHVFSIKRQNIVTKCLVAIKNLLCKKI